MSNTVANQPKPGTVTIIGSGIIGVCIANYLLMQGFSVDIIDPELPGSESQCSYGNAGGICPGSCVPNAMPGLLRNVPKWLLDPDGPLVVRLTHLPHALPWLLRFVAAGRKNNVEAISAAMANLHRYSFECYEPLLRAAGCQDLLQRRGQLFVYESAGGIGASSYALELRRRHGTKVEVLDEPQIQDLEPALAPIFKNAVFLPEQGQCPNPGRLVERLGELAARNGARFVRDRVCGFVVGDDGKVTALRMEGGTMPVDKVVVAAGVWSAALAKQLGDKIPLESERGYHIMVRDHGTGLRIQTISSDRKFVASPMENGLRITGYVELGGVGGRPDLRRADMLLRQARPMFRNFQLGETRRWSGQRPGTPDSIPVIDRASRSSNVIYAFGHGHQGMIGGSVTGKVVAELVAGKRPPIDLVPYRLDRFR